MRSSLNGVFWDRDALNLRVPHIGSSEEAVRLFEKNLPMIAFNAVSTLEHISLTYAQSVTISRGQSVSDMSIRDLNRVNNYFSGMRALADMIKAGQFGLNKYTACVLHGVTATGEAKNAGQFRNGPVGLYQVTYCPPDAWHLQEIAERGFGYLNNEVSDPKERAVGAFVFMARNQFFFDVNKRTASLMMNGILMSNGYAPLTFLEKSSQHFDNVLSEFYESGDANPMMRYFESQIVQLFEPSKVVPDPKASEMHR